MHQPSVADALSAAASGFYPSEAACALLVTTSWPNRHDFAEFITTGISIADGVTPMATVDWAGAVHALDSGLFPASGAERRLLRLAASLAEGIPVDLQDALTSLDEENFALVIEAIGHAAGHRLMA